VPDLGSASLAGTTAAPLLAGGGAVRLLAGRTAGGLGCPPQPLYYPLPVLRSSDRGVHNSQLLDLFLLHFRSSFRQYKEGRNAKQTTVGGRFASHLFLWGLLEGSPL